VSSMKLSMSIEIIDIVSCNNYDGFQHLNFNI
jgi:hypothetical protein